MAKQTKEQYYAIIMIMAISAMATFVSYSQLQDELSYSTQPVIKTHTEQSEVPQANINGDTYEVSCYTGYESHGANGREDEVSVATYQFPQGTWLEIEGIGKRRVDTVTSTTYSNRVDIWLGDGGEELYKYCLNEFGLKHLKIKEL